MKLVNEAEREYEGLTDNRMKDEQLEVAVKALHVIAVMNEGSSTPITNIAIDALKEMETFGYLYEQFTSEYEQLAAYCSILKKKCSFAGLYEKKVHCGLQKGNILETKVANMTKCPYKPKKRGKF